MPDTQDHRHGAGRLLTGTAWLVLLLGAWLWSGGGGQRADLPQRQPGPATGDMAAAGRPDRTGPAAPGAPSSASPTSPTSPAHTVRATPSPASVHLPGTGP
ncbi:hypothetical protein ACWEMW_24590 [Streptomyces sp. NPDC004684]